MLDFIKDKSASLLQTKTSGGVEEKESARHQEWQTYKSSETPNFGQLVLELDQDHDHRLSMEELLMIVDGHDQEADMPADARDAFAEIFNEADMDGDGFIGAEELPAFLTALDK